MFGIGVTLGSLGGGTASQSVVSVSHSAPYSDVPAVYVSHDANYDLQFALVHRSPYHIFQGCEANHSAKYDLSQFNPVASRHRSAYSLIDGLSVPPVKSVSEVSHNGRIVEVDSVRLSCDEGSPVWITNIEVSKIEDFALMRVGDEIGVSFGIENFALIIDGKTMIREDIVGVRCEVTAMSPACLLDSPFANSFSYSETAAMPAKQAVESFIGPVDWQLPFWIIPVGAVALSDATPMSAARSIVEAIGGVIESKPDGAIVCRRRHAVSIPEYGSAAVADQFFDDEVFSSSSRISPVRGFNRISIANEHELGGGGQATLEFVADGPRAGTVRAYVDPAEAYTLVHTGNPETVITPLGVVSRTEKEIVEFVAGRAKTHYPVAEVIGMTWYAVGLGDVTANGDALVSATPEYSLLEITYRVTTVDWRVDLNVSESVQFVLMEG